MSTTIVSQLSTEPGRDMYWDQWLVLVLKEDDVGRSLQAGGGPAEVVLDQWDWQLFNTDHGLDTKQAFADLARRLKAANLTPVEMHLASYAFVKTT